MDTLRNRFKNYRIAMNKTQQDIANECNISILTVIKFESGKDIKVSTLEKMLKAIGYSNALDNIIEDINVRPSFIMLNKNERKRASKKKENNKFIWEEDK